MSKLRNGLLAGLAGTAVINATTYLDMAIRGRPASGMPAEAADRLASRAGVSLGSDEDTAGARRSALGALSGYVTGITFGVAYAIASPVASRLPWPMSVALVGAGAMAATDAASALLGAADPRAWSAQAWAADAVPHLAYGVGVVVAYDALAG
jgi:hypothetical protein